MSDTLNICLACGLCCDGTLIGFVQLNREETPALKKIMDIEEADGNGFFLHPCKKYCDGCTIYNDRPKQCGIFKCGLLNSVEKEELAFDLAVESVNSVKQKKAAIEKLLEALNIELRSQSFYFKMVELKKLLKKIESNSALGEKHLELTAELISLDQLLLKEFEITLD